jgi:hypothetical protein
MEEERLLAKARLQSMRDFKVQQEQEQFMAQARINSFRDLRGDDMSVPSFARPPAPKQSIHRTRPNFGNNLQSVQEGKDLLDIDEDVHDNLPRPGIFRSSSDLTTDTAIKTPDDDLMSLAESEVYSHLDPRQNWKTQQNLSFRLQRPPVYADNAAGDLIQPSASFSTQSLYGGASTGFASTPVQPMAYAGRHMGYNAPQQFHTQPQQYAHMPPQQFRTAVPPQQTYASPAAASGSSNMSFQAAPPPTWESMNAAFAPTPSVAGSYAPQPQHHQPYQQQQQQQHQQQPTQMYY